MSKKNKAHAASQSNRAAVAPDPDPLPHCHKVHSMLEFALTGKNDVAESTAAEAMEAVADDLQTVWLALGAIPSGNFDLSAAIDRIRARAIVAATLVREELADAWDVRREDEGRADTDEATS
jgi:hypothetical protein